MWQGEVGSFGVQCSNWGGPPPPDSSSRGVLRVTGVGKGEGEEGWVLRLERLKVASRYLPTQEQEWGRRASTGARDSSSRGLLRMTSLCRGRVKRVGGGPPPVSSSGDLLRKKKGRGILDSGFHRNDGCARISIEGEEGNWGDPQPFGRLRAGSNLLPGREKGGDGEGRPALPDSSSRGVLRVTGVVKGEG